MNKLIGVVVLIWLLLQLDGAVLFGVIAGAVFLGFLLVLGCKGMSIRIGNMRFYF